MLVITNDTNFAPLYVAGADTARTGARVARMRDFLTPFPILLVDSNALEWKYISPVFYIRDKKHTRE